MYYPRGIPCFQIKTIITHISLYYVRITVRTQVSTPGHALPLSVSKCIHPALPVTDPNCCSGQYCSCGQIPYMLTTPPLPSGEARLPLLPPSVGGASTRGWTQH
eukprot:9495346-Pyramimonas_sp.AAC.2